MAQKVKEDKQAFRVAANNRRAWHDYEIIETLETGIVLTGSEIKSIRDGKMSLAEAYVRVDSGELWLIGSHITPYAYGGYANHEAVRPRKLLAHATEIRMLQERVEQKGMTIIPLKVVLKNGKAKVDIGVGRAKKNYDKRAATAERQSKRDVERELRDRG